MEKYVNDVVQRIMYSLNIDINDINEIIDLHKTVDNIQAKRLEMVLRDKIKQINVYLDEDFLDKLGKMLFSRNSKADVVDLRLINKNEVAIIREDSIELGDTLIDVNKLDAGLSLRGEAYSYEMCTTGKEPLNCDPRRVFSNFYIKIDNGIESLKKVLNIQNEKMYFDRELDSFYFDFPQLFNIIVTDEPNIIEIYEVDTTYDKWIPRKINSDEDCNLIYKIDFSLLNVNKIIEDVKITMKNRVIRNDLYEIAIEIALDNFKTGTFSIDNLIETYNSLFKNGNCMLDENESIIERLKFIAVEKLVEQGFTYEKALNYINVIFETIKLYKNQIIDAINGKNTFPKDSLVNTLEKISTANSTQKEGKVLVKKLK